MNEQIKHQHIINTILVFNDHEMNSDSDVLRNVIETRLINACRHMIEPIMENLDNAKDKNMDRKIFHIELTEE